MQNKNINTPKINKQKLNNNNNINIKNLILDHYDQNKVA